MNQNIALIAPFSDLANRAKDIIKRFDFQIEIVIGNQHEGFKLGRSLVKQGFEVLISRGGTAQLLKQELEVPVVEIRVSVYDILRALRKIKSRKGKIGIIGFENIVYGSQALAGLLDINLNVFTVHKREDVPVQVELARLSGVETIIGDKAVVSYSSDYFVKSILIESGQEAILQSFHDAKDMLAALRTKMEKTRRYYNMIKKFKAVLNAVDDQIIIVNEHAEVKSCNPSALKVMGKKDDSELIGRILPLYPKKPLKKLCKTQLAIRDHIAVLDGHHVMIDYLPIERNDEGMEVLIVGRDVTKIERSERKVRNEFHLKGHVARHRFEDILTEDEGFMRIKERARIFSSLASTLLICGETGTGKEMMAQSIHNESFGNDRPFVAVNCSTLPEPLLESELFGYASGSFTGAKKGGKKGFFELAHGGTLLLDEIGELPLNLQSRLLRVIEEREVQPLGEDKVIPIDVRIITSTNKDLALEVNRGCFREDLFYRINELPLKLPPLRERGMDVLVLFEHFIRQINPDCSAQIINNEKVKRLLLMHRWKGNAREVRSLVQRLAALTEGFTKFSSEPAMLIHEEVFSLDDGLLEKIPSVPEGLSLKDFQKQWIMRLAMSSEQRRKDIARTLGISRTTLWRKTRGPRST